MQRPLHHLIAVQPERPEMTPLEQYDPVAFGLILRAFVAQQKAREHTPDAGLPETTIETESGIVLVRQPTDDRDAIFYHNGVVTDLAKVWGRYREEVAGTCLRTAGGQRTDWDEHSVFLLDAVDATGKGPEAPNVVSIEVEEGAISGLAICTLAGLQTRKLFNPHDFLASVAQ